MKRIIAFIIIICMAFPYIVFAQGEEGKTTVYLFGDDWAFNWGSSFSGFVSDKAEFINAAGVGELMSKIDKKKEFARIKKDDVVILSYGILERDRMGDKNSEFEKNLDKTVKALQKKEARIVFASICSSMRYNTFTGKMEETKNFYTEKIRAYAKKNSITYVDLAKLTADWANILGPGEAQRLYMGTLSLTDKGNKMCAYEVFRCLCENEEIKTLFKSNISTVYTVAPSEKGKVLDVFFEEKICDYFTVYIRGGQNVTINSRPVENGNSTTVCSSVDGKINVLFSVCEKIQVTPCYRFNAQGADTTIAPYEAKTYPGVYDVTVKKTEPLKASVYLNSYLIASNLDMPGTQEVKEAAEHTFPSYHLEDGKISVTVKGLTDKLDFIAFRESPVIFDEKPRIFVGGDSTVCNYYPLVRTGAEADGTVMTGWAQLLHKYVDHEVINLASSGDWAEKWLGTTFDIVEKEGRKGDILILQFGINDRDKSTVEQMRAALTEMIERATNKGVIPILVSPQISAGYGWGDESDAGKSNGGVYEESFNAVRDLSYEKGCFYVDLTDLSSGWFSEVGREGVYKKYHLWDYENNKPGDMMHLSYKGADAMCRFFVMGVKKIVDEKKVDAWGNDLSLLKIW